MDYSKYYEARNIICDILRKDMLGPVSEHEILCGERPLEYYILGKLYPEQTEIDNTTSTTEADDIGDLEEEDSISLCNSSNPSSCGITFSINPGVLSIRIKASAFQYDIIDWNNAREKLKFDEKDYDPQKTVFWERQKPYVFDEDVDIETISSQKYIKTEIGGGLFLYIILHKIYADNSKIITVSLVNKNQTNRGEYLEQGRKAFFQPEIRISSDSVGAFGDVRKNVQLNGDKEILELEMLYSHVGVYASGHGCAVTWDHSLPCQWVKTEFLPEYNMLQMMPSREFNGDVLQMHYLATASKEDIAYGLKEYLKTYKKWIQDRETLDLPKIDEAYREIGKVNLEKCKEALGRLKKAVSLFDEPIIFRAFHLANEAMYMQRKALLEAKGKTVKPENICWYPFQLAFFLQEISSIAWHENPDYEKVDLLWFPTGGGKTEAYLGIAAFTIFLRRLMHKNNGDGVTVIMRYTLRLLTFQQFERAAAMICACEIIREREHISGGEIGIGLWAGKALTPNTLEAAKKILGGEEDSDAPTSNPRQLEKCPWCHSDIKPEDYSCDLKNKRMVVKCSNPKCYFHYGLPIYLVDEEIYEHKPSYVIATVDKFAQIAFNEDTANLFGKGKSVKIPPELIIQDELHLISGPLGTITGVYEAAITKLCEYKGKKPKIIASTATIRNAKDQIFELYGKGYTQFPPQGLDINDSFFAVLANEDQKPARKYIGCMAVGTSPTTMDIRIMAGLLYASRFLIGHGFSEEIIDSFWTITDYFNSLKELGGAIVRVEDDIQDRFSYLREKKFKKNYPLRENCKKRYDHYKELTSREKSSDIGKIIQNDLQIKYTEDESTYPYDFILASNMISVGVDVGRLGSMVVVGQPKSASEYIQATSRVGRETPGLVITAYNQARSRDRSHYEQFEQFHDSFNRYVEATSVTPFADRARDRTLQTLFVILCRYMIPGLRSDKDAGKFNRNLKGIKEIYDYILDYVEKVDPSEKENVSYELNEISAEWERRALANINLQYKENKYMHGNALFDPDYAEDSRFRALNSMRSVETTVKVATRE